MSLHSSLTENPFLKEYNADNCKYYYLPLFVDSYFPEFYAKALGACNSEDRSPKAIEESLLKARFSHSSHIKVPFDRASSPPMNKALSQIQADGWELVLQVCTQSLKEDSFFETLKDISPHYHIEWVLDHSVADVENRLLEISAKALSSHVSVLIHKALEWDQVLTQGILGSWPSVHLYAQYSFSDDDPFLTTQKIYSLLKTLRLRYPKTQFLPPKGVDLWDPRVRDDFDMEPFLYPCFATASSCPDIQYSVIIPTYNNQNHLRVVLRHLYKQSVGLNHFEVIIVDDGSADETQKLVIELVQSFPRSMNFKYIFFPRPAQRVMGDSQFRAGVSRNLGVKNATGDILCFLDSDIIVPENYLDRVSLALEEADALQAKRINLSREASSLDFNYDEAQENRDCIGNDPYWDEFLRNSKAWHKRPYNWKYLCTHSLSLRKDLFWKLGGIKRNFIFYGFEDTDLGYRLVKSGGKLSLLDVKVYHMFHENERSEFMNLKSLRHTLLSRTAQIFYRHHFDDDIYENLITFMGPEPSLKRLLRRLKKLVTLDIRRSSNSPVFKSLN
jgi:glycosyltransferase involved in cell wall biosynthesis